MDLRDELIKQVILVQWGGASPSNGCIGVRIQRTRVVSGTARLGAA